ncbi:MAG: TerB family tellurite resistance protein [Pseudomonadota bacterium]
MLQELIDRLFGPAYETPLAELDQRHALAGLMVRLAKADGEYAVAEIGLIDRTLQATYELDPVGAAKLRAEAEKLAALAPPDGRFAEMVCARCDPAQRVAVLTALWRVMLADGHVGPGESGYLTATADRLGLSADERAMAEREARAHPEPGAAL